jgi:hypothetical protein
MNCHEIENTLIERMDDLMPEAQRDQFDSHIASCGPCAASWRDQLSLRGRLSDLAGTLNRSSQRAAILERVAATVSAATATRSIATARLRWIGMAAATVIIALAVGLLPMPWSGHDAARTALAVARRVQETRSVRIEMQFQLPNGMVAARGAILSTPHRARIEEADGRIGVGEFESGRGMAIDPATRRVIEWQGRLEIPNLYQTFRELRPVAGSAPNEVQLDDRATLVFSARVLHVDATVWVDRATLLPVRLEYPMQMPINGELVPGTAVASNIAWDVLIDEALLSLEPPEGYEVTSRPAFTLPPPDAAPPPAIPDGAPESPAGTVETRLHNLVYGAILCGSRSDQCWPAEIARIAPHIHQGTLHNPDHPEYEIGFVYIRPAGPVAWGTAENRKLIFHERFEQWPGSLRVSYTDGTVERIEERERFERLAAEARRSGGE